MPSQPPIQEVLNDVKKVITLMKELHKEIEQLKKDKKDIIEIQNESNEWKKKYEDLNKLYERTWF